VATEAFPADGTSRALGATGPVSPDGELLAALLAVADEHVHTGPVVSTDLFYDGPEDEDWAASGALAVEMETATLFALAARRGFQAAALLVVSDLLRGGRTRIDPDRLRAAEGRLGAVALSALSAATVPSRER
jgi:uridine phosphorylase